MTFVVYIKFNVLFSISYLMHLCKVTLYCVDLQKLSVEVDLLQGW